MWERSLCAIARGAGSYKCARSPGDKVKGRAAAYQAMP